MTILHFAFIMNNPCNGVCVAVPQHVRAQAQWADVGLVNIQGTVITGLKEQLPYSEPFSLESLPGAFSRPDLVVFHDVYRLPFLSISRQLRKRGIPYIIVPHGCLRQEAQNQKWLKKRVGNMLLFNRFISGAVAIQCLSEQEMRKTKKGRQNFLGTNGVEIPVRKKESFRHDAIQITYIGRLDVYTKGLDMLLNAAKEQADFLRRRGCRIQLYGPDYRGRFTQVENLIQENGIGDFVTLNREVSGLP